MSLPEPLRSAWYLALVLWPRTPRRVAITMPDPPEVTVNLSLDDTAFRAAVERTRSRLHALPVAPSDPPSDPVYRDAMPDVGPVPMPPPGSTHCMRGEICGLRHPLYGEHLVTAQPAIEWTRERWTP